MQRDRVDQHTRINRIRERALAALIYLQTSGPATLDQITRAILHPRTRVKYAVATLVDDRKAHIARFERMDGADGIPRHVGVFAAGEGVNAVLPRIAKLEGETALDFESTLHLQSIYLEWTATREPEDRSEY